MTLRVGVDATCWLNRRGFGRFTRNAVPRLIAAHVDAEYILYIDRLSSTEARLPPEASVRAVELSEPPIQAAAAGSTRKIRDLLRLARAVRADRPDVFLFPSLYTFFP